MSGQRCAIYARYSSHEQDGSSTIESQIRACRTYAREHGLVIQEDAHLRGSRAGGHDGRNPGRVQGHDRCGPADATALRDHSRVEVGRFARNREESIVHKALLRRRGVELISIREPVDRGSPFGMLIEAFIEIQDQLYSANLAEEVRRGQTETTLDGFSTGGRAPYGYRRLEVPDPRGRVDRRGQPVVRVTLELEPAEAAVVLRIFETYAQGAGYKKLVLALNRERIQGPRGGTWDVSAVREILRNDAYRGTRAFGRIEKVRTAQGTRSKRSKPVETWTVKEAAHPAIVSQELWDRMRRKREHVAQVHREHGMAQAQLPHT